MAKAQAKDASGNVRYGDIGVVPAGQDHRALRAGGTAITLKYIDPSYTIRSVPATPHDSAFCLLLGHSAAHAAMSGRTNLVVSFWNHRFTHVPIRLAVSERKKIDPEGRSGRVCSPRPGSRGTCADGGPPAAASWPGTAATACQVASGS